MARSYEIIAQLTDPELPASQRRGALKRFADENGWLPSDEIDEYAGTEEVSNGHLLIEHGLDNTAVITFLKNSHPFGELSEVQQIRLLGISYNHLAEWHLFPDRGGVTRVYNRVSPISEGTKYVSVNEERDVWKAEAFDKVTGRRPNPNVKALDDALMETIAYWKKLLSVELGGSIGNENISALFNAIIFARAMEDDRRRRSPNPDFLLITQWMESRARSKTIRACLRKCIGDMAGGKGYPKELLEVKKLRVFDALDWDTVTKMLRDFYINRYAQYAYDFSLMSKHALSRIYEHYVSLLSREDSTQPTLFEDLPKELRNRTYGGIYTPQYIARFFARYLRENLTPIRFRGLKTADPACGSGIFLRTILEMQCDPLQDITMEKPTQNAFANVFGIDRDENACQATRLSLALLHLVLMDEFPSNLKIENAEAVKYVSEHEELAESFDAVIANPPFIPWGKMEMDLREQVKDFMGEYRKGKPDLYLAFLKMGMSMLKAGGHLLYVVPHSFLITENAERIRSKLAEEYWIKFIVDLSEIDVFEGIGAYVILLIVQKKFEGETGRGRTVIVRSRELPGHALQAALEGKRISSDAYEIYEIDQEVFAGHQWQLMSPEEFELKRRLDDLPAAEEFLKIRVGFNTGANEVFVRNASQVPKGEGDVYVAYLRDRDMIRYDIPEKTDKVVFYPYVGGEKVTEEELKKKYRKTWDYLTRHAEALKGRQAVIKRNCEWWCPERARLPENMLIPKIITPHLSIWPKFSLDAEGKYAVSRAPLMYLKKQEGGIDLMHYFLGILNSSVVYWQIANLSHKYRGGYFMLEPKTLKQLRVPDPKDVSPKDRKRLQELVETRIRNENRELESEIDMVVTDIYGLNERQQEALGIVDNVS